MGGILIKVDHVSKHFGTRVALSNVSLTMKPGEVYGLLGTNGAGKTTLMKTLTGYYPLEGGSVSFGELDLRHDYKQIKQHIGLVPQNVSCYQDFSVEQNIAFFGRLNNLSGKKLRERVTYLMEWLSLTPFQKMTARRLSGGYQRLLNIACTLVSDPEVIFLDEPTVGLDPAMRKMFWEKIDELRDAKKTICLTTHYMDEAEHLCDQVSIIKDGEIIASGDPLDLIEEYGGKKVAIIAIDQPVDPDFIKSLKLIMANSDIHGISNTLVISLNQKESLQKLSLLTDFIEKKGYAIQNSIVKEPDLENVFINLTGQTSRD